jgi:GNAT superfamily N-acetyltransferase
MLDTRPIIGGCVSDVEAGDQSRDSTLVVSAWDSTSTNALATLRAALALWKKNSSTLGFLPTAAFTDRARKGGFLVGEVDGKVAGYCLFDIHRAGYIKLVHVCVDDDARGTGLGKAMVDFAIEQNPMATGVLADCRRDYGIDRFWQSVGMFPKSEKPGRAKSGSILIRWWRALGQLDLFEEAALSSGLPLVAIDSNIVSDLWGSPDGRTNRELSMSLLSDWMQEAVTLAVSVKVNVEINAIQDGAERKKQNDGAAYLMRLRTTRPDDRAIEDELTAHIDEALLKKDASLRDDVEHLADAIRAGADYFVTNDSNFIAGTAQWAAQRYGIDVVRPHKLVAEIGRGLDRPMFESRLIETVDLAWSAAVDRDEAELDALFRAPDEKPPLFRQRVRQAIAGHPATKAEVLHDDRDRAWALVAFGLDGDELVVTMFRVLRGERAPTTALQLARYLRRQAVEASAKTVRIDDPHLEDAVLDALRLDPFDLTSAVPTATVVNRRWSMRELAENLPEEDVTGAERRFWPLLVVESQVPTYLVPIHPRHAERLFGYSDGALFHMRRRSLGLSRELVYFHAGQEKLPSGPSRLIWYVTADKTTEVRRVVGFSRATESLRLPPKEAHERFGHLGVLGPRDIEAVAKRGKVHVVRFEDTELLSTPLSRNDLKPLFERHGVKANFPSLRKVPTPLFDEIVLNHL